MYNIEYERTWWRLFQERTWWRFFQKRVVRTKFDIYVLNSSIERLCETYIWSPSFVCIKKWVFMFHYRYYSTVFFCQSDSNLHADQNVVRRTFILFTLFLFVCLWCCPTHILLCFFSLNLFCSSSCVLCT
jgi:hypothetical protein